MTVERKIDHSTTVYEETDAIMGLTYKVYVTDFGDGGLTVLITPIAYRGKKIAEHEIKPCDMGFGIDDIK